MYFKVITLVLLLGLDMKELASGSDTMGMLPWKQTIDITNTTNKLNLKGSLEFHIALMKKTVNFMLQLTLSNLISKGDKSNFDRIRERFELERFELREVIY